MTERGKFAKGSIDQVGVIVDFAHLDDLCVECQHHSNRKTGTQHTTGDMV